MHPIMCKFEMFADAKARPILLDFKRNYELVASGLEQCWASIQDEKSKRGDIMADLAKANEALRAAAAQGASFVRRDAASSLKGEIHCPNCGATGLPAAFPDYQHQGMYRNGPGREYKNCPNPACRSGGPFDMQQQLQNAEKPNMVAD